MSEKPSKEKTIATQYAELNRYGQNGEYERALKSANKILGVAPHENLAFQCKIVCLIQLSKFDEALSLMNKNPQFLQDLIFEKAYCYYRANKPEEALATIDQCEDEIDFRIKELKAQILYRLEKFEDTQTIYHEIIKNTDDEYEDERYTNLSAVMVYLNPNEAEVKLGKLKDNTYELCYNKACLLLGTENYAEAEKKLKLGEKLCREALEEDEATEEEIDVELALFRIQLGYVYQKLGRIKESQQLYISSLKSKIEDIALMAVASNNIVCINKDQNLFDSKKKMKVAQNDALLYKLPSTQRKMIALNNAIFNYYINQNEQCDKLCNNIDQVWPELSTQTKILRALNLIKLDKMKDAIDLLEKSKTNEDKLYINLCIAQLYLIQGDKLKACKILENLGNDSYKPAIVGALTTLYLGLGDEEKALKVFEKTVDFYKKNKIKGVDLTSLWRQAAEFHIRKGLPQVAANSLEELLRANIGDKKIVAQLVLALSQFDKEKALKLSEQLPSIDELSEGVDIENIQNFSINTAVNFTKKSPASKQESLPSTPAEEATKKARKHKKRKGKLPKNYDASAMPDPERWLPRYERTGFRRKRDRRAKDIIKGSQGTASGQADQYDFSKYVEEAGSADASTNTVDPSPRNSIGTTPKSQHSQKKGQQKRKNKRR